MQQMKVEVKCKFPSIGNVSRFCCHFTILFNRRMINHKHYNPKQILRTLFESERWLKLRVDKVGLLLRHLYGYNSLCFLKSVNLLRLPGRLNLVTISSCFKNTHHLTQTEGRSLDEKRFQSKNRRLRGFTAHSKHFTYMVKMVKTPYPGLFILAFIQIKSKINKKTRSRILTS